MQPLIGILQGVLVWTVLAGPIFAAPQQPPNIVFVLTDDMGPGDLGCYGGKISPTPSIDKFASEGIRFTNYYSASPICSPSRCGLITGQFPARWQITSFLQTQAGNKACGQKDFLDPKAPSLPGILKAAGYATAHIGKWHLGGGRDVISPPGFNAYGYDTGLGTYESPKPAGPLGFKTVPWGREIEPGQVPRHQRTRWMVDQTISFIKEHPGQPCFVNLWLDDVHTPWVPQQDLELRKGETRPRLSQVLSELDKQMGRLMQGLPENTLMVFASDNGPLPTLNGIRTLGVRGSKLSLYEGGIRMPFMARWPGKIPAGKVNCSTVIAAVDMVPSLAAIAGAKLPADYIGDGEDLSQAILGKPCQRNKPLFWEYGRNETSFKYPAGKDRSPSLAMRQGHWKFLCNHDGKATELYDLDADPLESKNLVDQQKDLSQTMKAALINHWNILPKLEH